MACCAYSPLLAFPLLESPLVDAPFWGVSLSGDVRRSRDLKAECGWFSALGSITVGAIKIIVSDKLVENLSAPPTSGVIGASTPVVPGMPEVSVFSSLRVRPASTTTSPGAAQNTVSITSEVLSDNSLTRSSVVLNRVSVRME